MWKGGRRPEVSLIHREYRRRFVSFIFVTCPFFNVFSFNGVSSVSRETRKLAERDPWRILETPPKLEPSTPSNPITFRSTFFFFFFFPAERCRAGKQEVADEVSIFERWRVLRDLTCEEIPRDMTQSSRDNHVHK